MGQDSTTAILIFANSSEWELSNKPHINSTAIFDVLTKHTLSTVHSTGLPYFHFTENSQKGDSFKVRFTNALEQVFEMGFSNVISIGNDSPQLKTSDLLQANMQLQAGRIVLGPSADGGIYMMGIHRDDFRALEFLNLPWQTSDLYQSLLDLVSRRKDVVRLKILFDLDNREDLKLFISRFHNITKSLLVVIQDLLQPPKTRIQSSFFNRQTFFSSIFFNKGSPIMFR